MDPDRTHRRHDAGSVNQQHQAYAADFEKVSDRIRTGDRLDHNQELYQLSYAHRAPQI